MDEYIKREVIYVDFAQCNSRNSKWTPQRVAQMIYRQPAADVAPVVHAKYDSNHCCSNCGEMALEAPYPGTYYHTLYCWACNAKMDNGFRIGDVND